MAAQQQQGGQAATPARQGVPLQQGALFGAAAFVVGYVMTFVWTMIDTESNEIENTFEVAGWLFFNAQFVRIEPEGSATFDMLSTLAAADVLSLPALVFTVAVALILFGAGYLVTDRYMTPGMSADEGTVYGASIAVGYLPLAFLGALLFETSEPPFTDTTPDIFGAVLLAGIVFPALVGALGGYYAVRSRGS